jgi:glycosyltransferase involved in cell wall biosynthesis
VRFLTVNCVPDASERALYLALPTFGDQVDIAVAPRDPHLAKYKENGLKVTTLEIKNRLDFNAAKILREIILSRKIEVVYAPDNKSLAATLLAGRGLDLKYVTYRGTQGNLSLWNPAVLLTHRNPRVNKIICNCRAVANYVRKVGVAESKIEVVLKGHDRSWYKPKQSLSRADFGLAETDFVVGLVANLRPLKGVDKLFAAIEKTAKKIPIKGLIVGDYDELYLNKLFKLYNVKDYVQCLGFRNDAPAILSLCNVSAVPSLRREGVPRSMIESMANKIPVIGTSIGGIPEIIEDRVSGFIVPPGDADALAEKLVYLYLHPQELAKMGEAAQSRIINRVDLKGYINKMRDIFENS